MTDERLVMIEKIRRLPEQVAELVSGLSDEQMTTHFIEGEWTVAQNVHHLCDSHMNSYIRCKLMLTEDNPPLKPYDQDMWAALPDASGVDVGASLKLLAGLHNRWVTFWQTLPDAAWSRTGFHPESGKVTLADQLRLYAAHGEGHLRQMGNTLAAQPLDMIGENLTKTRLLSMAMSSRVYFAELWAGLTEAQFLEPDVEEGWSLKDIIAHVVSWERWMCGSLATAVAGDTPFIIQSDEDVDRMNAEFTTANSAKSLAQVLAEWSENEGKLEAAITAVPATALFDNNYYDWRNGRPLSWMVVGNTFGHYQDHIDPIVSKFH
ncbi:MAG: DinB family protein [Anaerolineae bacterium]|nr:DinB family protein [Anaerolineae bacterium]